MSEVPVTAPGEVIVAKASRDYRWRRYALTLMIVGWGCWSLYDGYVKYPAQNAEDKRLHPGIEILSHTDLDIKLNRILGMCMPPAGLLFLGWMLYASRGSYRYDGAALDTPGHGSVSLKSIRKIDRAKWDRKGIAYLHYQVAGSAKLNVITLDDFIYERRPTDEIFNQISIALDISKPV